MKIIARCHPQLEPLLPKPVPATQARPGWLRDMPGEVAANSLNGATIRTVKHCPPFIDALSAGILIPLATDLHVADGQVAWDWDPPAITDAPITRAPIGLHVPEQAHGGPFDTGAKDLIVKFINFWTLEAPEGWSLLFTHPFNRDDLPFRTLTGLVDCDRFAHGYVHFPALWSDPGFAGTLPAGTPVAQVLAIPRDAPTLQVGTMGTDDIAASRKVQEALQAETGVYRKNFRH